MRVGTIVFGGLVLAYAVVLAFAGEARTAVSGVLVGAGAIALVTWARGIPAREWLATGMLLVGVGLIGSPLFAALLLLAAVLLQLWLSGRMRRRLPDELEVVGAEEVMPGAEEAVAAFEALGFRRSGAYATQVPQLLQSKRVVGSVLIGPEANRVAIANDRIVEVVSRFGDRWLVTINSGRAPVSADKLRQVVHGEPRELAAAHESALEVLAARGVHADRLADDDDPVEAAVELEKGAIAFVSGAGMATTFRTELRRKASEPVVRDDEPSRRRVDDWLAADAPTSSRA